MVPPAKDETATTLDQRVNSVCFLLLAPILIHKW